MNKSNQIRINNDLGYWEMNIRKYDGQGSGRSFVGWLYQGKLILERRELLF
jgi:hypothetical protein